MNVAMMRHNSGLSQRQFAAHFGIPVRTLQQWEQGKSAPPDYVTSMMRQLLPAQPVIPSQRNPRHSIPPRNRWRVCIDRPFPHCERVYPTQQRKVRELIDDFARDPAVRRIIIFGSSVTQRCRIDSDVDVYVDMSDAHHPAQRAHDFPYDLWTNFSADERLKEEIHRKGVTVYDQRDNTLR